MHWSDRPVESIPVREFVPPHCPWQTCAAHALDDPACFRFYRHGVFIRESDGRVVPRFRCRTCSRTFSQQTFATSYYLKGPELSAAIAAGLNAGSAHRQLARSLGCSPSTVTRRAARLGRHALLLLALAIESIRAIREPVVYDDFESFAYSQDLPLGIGTAVGQRSWFVYGLEHAPHRRGGRLSPAQKARKRAAPNEPSGAYRRAFRRTLDLLAAKIPPRGRLDIVTDDHPGYRGGLRGHPRRKRIRHHVFPNPARPHKDAPRTSAARQRDREMFAVDLLHGLIRHTLANHKRETIAFGRRVNALLERVFLMAIWRNFVKGRSERRPDPTTPGMRLGLADEPWSWERVLARRLFPSRIQVPQPWLRIYCREIVTPQVGRNTTHALAQAF